MFLVRMFHPQAWSKFVAKIQLNSKTEPHNINTLPDTDRDVDVVPKKITEKAPTNEAFNKALARLAETYHDDKTRLLEFLGAKNLQDLHPPALPPKKDLTHFEVKRVKPAQRARMVTIAINEMHRPIISWVGAFHSWYTPNQDWQHTENKDEDENKVQMTIYGLGLDPRFASEIQTWKGVEYFDIYDLFLKATDTPVKLPPNPSVDQWRSLVIYHAVNKYNKVLYFDPNVIILNRIDEIEKELEERGAIFFQMPDKTGAHYAYEFDQCHVGLQGYKLSSFAFDAMLAPQIKCATRACTQDELKLFSQSMREKLMQDATHKKQLECTTQFNHLFRPHEAAVDNRLSCHLIKRDDMIYGPGQLPHSGGRKISATLRDQNDKRIHVALGFPSTSKGNPNPTIDNTPFMSVFLPSFLASIDKNDADKYLYRLYLGFDAHDAFFDNPDTQKAYIAEVKKRSEGYPVTFEMLRISYSRGWVVFLWDAIFQHAIERGADYFYQLNDDIKFITPGWTAPMIKVLKDSRVPDIGVAAPVDINNGNTFTQVFISKRHYDVFGTLYPYIFENWYSDDWATVIYQKTGLVFRTPFQLQNAQSFGTRYEVCSDQGAARLVVSRAIGERMLDTYIAEHGSDPWK